MDLYLMQHGEAASEEEDPARPLTDAGRDAVRRVAARAEAAGVRVERVVHSGKLRAEQTAGLLAERVAPGVEVRQRDGLAPKDPVDPVAQWLRGESGGASLAVVGHLPFLDQLAALLLTGREDAAVVRFHPGGLVRLEPRDAGDGYRLVWALPPDLA